MFVYPAEAIAREKEIKGWRRSKKIALIEAMNRAGMIWRQNGRTSTNRSTGFLPIRARSFTA